MKRPSFQFYPGDWLQDTALRACCLGARGLWADMLCYMHQGTPYGHLTLPAVSEDGGKDILRPILPPVLARMVGGTSEDVERLLTELEHAGVFSRTAEGVIFSRRMVQDEQLREARASGGVSSLKNPNVPRPKNGRKDTFSGSLGESFGGSPSSSSSSSSNLKPTDGNSNECRTGATVMPEGFNSTSVAQMVCQRNGWSGWQLIWTLKDAIDFQAKQMPESSLVEVAEWLAQSYRAHRASKGKFAAGAQKYFSEGLYQSSEPSTTRAATNILIDNPATRALAQMEGD